MRFQTIQQTNAYKRTFESLRYAYMLFMVSLLSACSKPMLSDNEVERLKKIDKEIEQQSNYYASHREVPDFSQFKITADKKKAFFEFLGPAVDAQNLTAEKHLIWLTAIEAQQHAEGSLSGKQLEWFKTLSKHYRVDEESVENSIKLLNDRVGMLPKELVLAQAANESAWGTSRFARQGNNFFGQWCYSTGCGIVPKSRPEGATHEVASFSSPYESVEAYFRNLNSNKAYSSLRQIRDQLVKQEKEPSAEQLAEGLLKYSERGASYVEDITQLIETNRVLMQ